VSRLRIGGLVAAPQDLDFGALRAVPEQLREPSQLLGGREIVAVSLARLLGIAGVAGAGRSIVAESADGSFVTTLPLEAAEQCVVVYRVGEAPLPLVLGGPIRLVTHGRVRCGDVKDLGAIYVSDRPFVDGGETGRVCVRASRSAA
jgi:DMSO/TMAO reductase YedYZ molybdopterin-dependent catalytic subunit